jgi:hypothetical protein
MYDMNWNLSKLCNISLGKLPFPAKKCITVNYHYEFIITPTQATFLGTGHYLSPGGRKKVGRVMKKLEIDRGRVTAFLVDQAGGHDFF